MSNDLVSVTVSLANPGVTQAGFGIGMIPSYSADWAERTREYADASEVLADFPTVDDVLTPEYMAARAYFAQTPRPELVVIGRCDNAPTQRFKIAPFVSGANTYTLTLGPIGDAKQEATYVAGDALPGIVTSAAGPYDFRGISTPNIRAVFNAGGNQDFSISATSATKAGSAGSYAATGTFDVIFSGGILSSVTVTAAANATAMAAQINPQINGGVAVVNGTAVDLVSDQKGSTRTCIVSNVVDSVGSMGLAAGTATGTGTVTNSGAVTAAELATIMSAITNGTATVVAGALRLTSATTGASGTATVAAASTADVIMGGEFATNTVGTGTDAGGTTIALIVAGLRDAVDALADPVISGAGAHQFTTSITGSGSTSALRILANTAGDMWEVEIASASLLTIAQDHADPGITSDLDAILDENRDWYAFDTMFTSYALALAASQWAETATKLYGVSSQDSIIIQTGYDVATTTDIASKTKALSERYTSVFYHRTPDEFIGFARLGRWLPITPGQDNWCEKSLTLVTPGVFSTSQKTNAAAKYTSIYYVMGGANIVSKKGWVASGSYIDSTRGIDQVVAWVVQDASNWFIQNERVPGTDAGIAGTIGVLRGSVGKGVAAGIINAGNGLPATNPDYVAAPTVTSGGVNTIVARNLPGCLIGFKLAGAIDSLSVRISVTE